MDGPKAPAASMPPVERYFEHGRLHKQHLAAAYQSLVPSIRRLLPAREPARGAVEASCPQAKGVS